MTSISDVVMAEINSVKNSTVAPEPIIRLFKHTNHPSEPITIRLASHMTCESDSFLKDNVYSHARVELDLANRCVHLRWSSHDDIVASIVNKFSSEVCSFIIRMQDSKNAKLTALYRWYDTFAHKARYKEDLQVDLFYITKYIMSKANTTMRGDDVSTGIIQALEFIKNKYSDRGLKLT